MDMVTATNGNGSGRRFDPPAGTPDRSSIGSRSTLAPMPEAPVSLHILRAELWRRRRFWIATAVAGLMIGALFHLAVPRKYSAQSTLYLVQPTGANPAQVMASDMSLLGTRAVAQHAISTAHLRVSTNGLLASYRASGSGGTILTITTSATSSHAAVAWNNAVAGAFLGYRAAQFRLQTQVLVEGLRGQIGTLQRDVAQLGVSINALAGVPGTAAADQVTNLATERTADITQIAQLEAEIQQDQLDAISVAGGSRILDPAAVHQVSAVKVVAADALTGLVGGLGAGILVILVASVLSDRPRRRQDVARALGAPVELSTPRPGSLRRRRRHRSSRTGQQTDGETAAMVRVLGGHLATSPDGAVVAVPVGAPDAAARAVIGLARALTADHERVLLADLTADGTLRALVDADSRRHTSEDPGAGTEDPTRIELVEGPCRSDPAAPSRSNRRGDPLVVLAPVDPANGADHLWGWARHAVVFVGAGRVSATLLHSTGVLLRHAGLHVASAVLVGADPRDATAGQPEDTTVDPLPHGGLWTRRVFGSVEQQ